MKIGLLGGSFNPAHTGHRYISIEAIRRLGLNQVWWLVTNKNPLKTSNPMPREGRISKAKEMADYPYIKVLALDDRTGSSYTIDVVKYLKRTHPEVKFVWIMGADNLLNFHFWKKWQDILKYIPIVVINRGEIMHTGLRHRFAIRFGKYRNSRWHFLAIRKHPESSTKIRAFK